MTEKIDYPTDSDFKIVFGDWCMATLRGMRVDAKEDKVTFVFVPDPFMRWAHQIPDSDYDQTQWVIKRSYPREHCFCVNPDPKYQTWFLLCDYAGNVCDTSVEINKQLAAKLRTIKDERDAWQKHAILMGIKLKKIVSHPEEFKTDFLEKLSKQKKLMGSEGIQITPKPTGSG